MTSRCLINLKSVEEQIIAVKNIWSILKDNGIYLMMENFIEPLNNLNKERNKFNLPSINVRWHNLYLNEDFFVNDISDIFKVEKIDNFASTYYLISRTLNAILNVDNSEPNYNSPLNKLASKLMPLGDFSPEKLIMLRKIRE